MKKRTKELSIPIKVKETVAKRDSFDGWPCCLLCGTPAPSEYPLAFSNAHYIRRSQGGLGIEENILTLCPDCHRWFDESGEKRLMEKFAKYLQGCYPKWDEEELRYKK